MQDNLHTWLDEPLTLSEGTVPAPPGFLVNISFDSQIMGISRQKYLYELYRRPGPRLGKAYGRAMHRAMKRHRGPCALRAATTIYKDWGK